MKQVIKITPDGAMHGLQKKPGQGIDLTQFGKARIERVTDIKFDPEEQKWFITFLRGELKGKILDHSLYSEVTGNSVEDLAGVVIHFENYDLAVNFEVKFLDAARAQGLYPELFTV